MRSRWLIVLFALVALLAAACGGGGDDDSGDGDDDDTDESPTPQQTLPPGDVEVEDLAQAVVQITALADGDPVWGGSGTLVSEDGLILTNAHVVDDRYDEYDELGVALTRETDEIPELEYLAEIRAVDYALDLAVIEITEEYDGGDVDETFPFVPIGDSDDVGIGDEIQILGYPGIGGDTITFTQGAVSGFTGERSVGDRAWIKTDATIAGGNSGGLAVNEDGELIGVPTTAGSGSDASFVDCRFLADTNGDGFLDDEDNCVPVGGFINGLRPTALALALIEAAEDGEEYVSPYYEEDAIEDAPSGGFDAEDVRIYSVVFAPGVTDADEPTEVILLAPSATPRLCAFWEYEGMQDGMTWDAIWYIDGEQDESGSILGDTWVGGDSGSWWVCIVDELEGLPDGLYEVVISVEGDPSGSEAIFVGGQHAPSELDIDNQSSNEVCGVWLSPTGAENWGIEELGRETILPAGELVTIGLATGTYDMLLVDCNGDTILEEYELEILEPSVYTITDS